MPDLRKIVLETVSLDLSGDGTASFVTSFPCEIVKVEITGAGSAATGEVLVNAVSKGTFTLTSGAGSKGVTRGVAVASSASATNVNAQKGGDPLGTVKQANATTVGYVNTLAPTVPGDTVVADNVASGATVEVKHNVAVSATGSAVVTLHKQ